jgi:hypothetical protein
MFVRVPVVPRYSRARMSSMARLTARIAQLRQEVNRPLLHTLRDLRWLAITSTADYPGDNPILMGHDRVGFATREVGRCRESNRIWKGQGEMEGSLLQRSMCGANGSDQ